MPQVTILKPHTHKGQSLPIGAGIEVNDADAAWLIKHGIGANHASNKQRRVDKSPSAESPSAGSDLTNEGDTNG